MKLSNETLSILKNFSSISEGLYVPAGSRIRIKNSKSNVLAQAVVGENFPTFCVQELNRFLGVLTVDKDVDVEFKGPNIVLSFLAGRSKITYRCAAQTLVNVPKDTDMTIAEDEAFARFTLTSEIMRFIEKGLGLLGLGYVAFEYDGEKLFVRLFDPTNDAADQQTFELEGYSVSPEAKSFQIIFPSDSLTFVDGNYTVLLAQERAQFQHDKLSLQYWLAPDLGSRYE